MNAMLTGNRGRAKAHRRGRGVTRRLPAAATPAVLGAALLAAVIVATALTPAARADGDPASDFLLSQSTFLSPYDGHVAPASATQLVQMLTAATAKGFSLKVAVIVTPYDLGSVPILFDKPQTYAKFLGEEDYYYWKTELVVVMPNGFGIYKATGVPPGDRATIARLWPPQTRNGTALVLAAERAVRALAARRGITLSATAGAGAKASGGLAWWELVVAGVVALGLLAAALPFGRRRRAAR
jgi:hypothetical protein